MFYKRAFTVGLLGWTMCLIASAQDLVAPTFSSAGSAGPGLVLTVGELAVGSSSAGGIILRRGALPSWLASSACEACDTDCNGTVNPFDIQLFLDLLNAVDVPCSPCAGDANENGTINPFDINAFLECLT